MRQIKLAIRQLLGARKYGVSYRIRIVGYIPDGRESRLPNVYIDHIKREQRLNILGFPNWNILGGHSTPPRGFTPMRRLT